MATKRASKVGDVKGMPSAEKLIALQSKVEKTVWETSCNDKDTLLNFEVDITKTSSSQQRFEDEFRDICRMNGVTRCPFLSTSVDSCGKVKVRLLNTTIDIFNWQSMILAAVSTNASAFYFNSLQLIPKHISDFGIGILRLDCVLELTFDYIQLDDPNVLSSAVYSNAKFISLRGNKLNDDFAKTASTLLATNVYVQAINLSENLITDQGANYLLDCLRLNPSLNFFALRRNQCSGSCLSSFFSLQIGSLFPSTETPSLKSITGLVNARNKKMKDQAKKAKEASFEEIPSLDSRVFSSGGINYIANRSLRRFDLSWNPLQEDAIIAAIKQAALLPTLSISADMMSTTVTIKGIEASNGGKALEKMAQKLGLGFSLEL